MSSPARTCWQHAPSTASSRCRCAGAVDPASSRVEGGQRSYYGVNQPESSRRVHKLHKRERSAHTLESCGSRANARSDVARLALTCGERPKMSPNGTRRIFSDLSELILLSRGQTGHIEATQVGSVGPHSKRRAEADLLTCHGPTYMIVSHLKFTIILNQERTVYTPK